MGEAKREALAVQQEPIALDTFGGRIHVEWDPAAAVTPLGQLPFFIEFLKVNGRFAAWVADCPLAKRMATSTLSTERTRSGMSQRLGDTLGEGTTK